MPVGFATAAVGQGVLQGAYQFFARGWAQVLFIGHGRSLPREQKKNKSRLAACCQARHGLTFPGHRTILDRRAKGLLSQQRTKVVENIEEYSVFRIRITKVPEGWVGLGFPMVELEDGTLMHDGMSVETLPLASRQEVRNVLIAQSDGRPIVDAEDP
jgi:hypothetical protein